ncbi:oligosaccharide flippase family protein [Patescibacteria group bacterium]|nr:oligosaccharide flippase family protein [Patescibacteria group bacterium]MBU4461506.1 oligosaccharide flippase family protein [Patescibacteria group bacterium]MCG2699956.1 oligosaccharide flippase family protein [Candidatus Parcubacteria bacterium]
MSLAKNSFTIFYSKVIITFLAFVVQIILSRKVGPEALGVYNLFLATVGTFIFLGNFGVGNASIYLINKQKKNPIQLLSNILIFGILWGIILAGVFFLIFLTFPYLFSGLSINYIFLVFLAIPLTLLHNYLLPFFLAKFQISKWTLLSILCDFLILLGTIVMVIVLGFGIKGAIWAVVISYVVTLLFILLYIFKLFLPSFVFNVRLFYEEIKFGVSSYLGDIFSGAKISFMLSAFIINVSLGIAGVGYYSVAYNIAAILLFIPFSFQQILYSKWSISDEKEVDRRTPEIGRQILILGFLVALFLTLVGKQFIILFFGKGFYLAFLPMLWVLPGFIFMSFASIFFNNFFAKGKPYITTIILAITLTINVVLSLVLIPIPTIGMNGASISISISYFIAAILSILIFAKNSGYSFWKIIIVKPVDFKNFYFNFRNVFRFKKY